jgi:N-acetyltransferase 10
MVNRDALFSYHPASEVFLQRMMALYVASHYKNSPNDLQLMSDAPGHRLFVLLAPLTGSEAGLPEPLCVVQVALEGNISRAAVLNSLSRGTREAGDLIPWLVAQQFQDADFASLSGARVVRIAVHPDYARMGYGARALQALEAFYSGQLLDVDNVREDLDDGETFAAVRDKKISKEITLLQGDEIKVRDASRMPALLQRLSVRRPESLDWLGVSYGLTPSLFKFWKKAGYVPLWVRQIPNELTGEYTTVQLKALDSSTTTTGSAWLGALATDFRKRFITLLSFKFREFSTITALTVLEAATQGARLDEAEPDSAASKALVASELRPLLTPFDMKRLESYASNMVEMSVVLDLLPTLAALYFNNRLRAVREDEAAASAIDAADEEEELRLTGLQSSLLLAIGLQRKTPDDIGAEMRLPLQQTMALFVKTVRLLVKSLRKVEKKDIAMSMPELGAGDARAPLRRKANGETVDADDWSALKSDLGSELQAAGKEFLTSHQEGRNHLTKNEERNEASDNDSQDGDHAESDSDGQGDDAQTLDAKKKLIDAMNLSKYAIKDAAEGGPDWSQAEAEVAKMVMQTGGKDLTGFNTTISVKGTKRAADEEKAASPVKKASKGDTKKGTRSKKQKHR